MCNKCAKNMLQFAAYRYLDQEESLAELRQHKCIKVNVRCRAFICSLGKKSTPPHIATVPKKNLSDEKNHRVSSRSGGKRPFPDLSAGNAFLFPIVALEWEWSIA